MANGKWVSYLRVSTGRQGASGLGSEAQRNTVAAFLNGCQWTLLKEFVEVESGAKSDRPQLNEALRMCRLYGAKLVIAKLDRLSRDAHFLLGLERAGVDFVAADMPNANRLTIGILALVAEQAASPDQRACQGGDGGSQEPRHQTRREASGCAVFLLQGCCRDRPQAARRLACGGDHASNQGAAG